MVHSFLSEIQYPDLSASTHNYIARYLHDLQTSASDSKFASPEHSPVNNKESLALFIGSSEIQTGSYTLTFET
jgi:hypothetical protein